MMAWIDELTVTLELPPSTAHSLRLCLEEAVTNVTLHAFEPETAHAVRIAVMRDNKTLYVEVTDDGRPFDPLAYGSPALPKDLQSAPIGGLGIKLMRSFADAITYRRCGGFNRLRLSFIIPKPVPGHDRPGGPTRDSDLE